MKSLVQFLNRVMDNVENGIITEGFLGTVLTVIPEDFHDARWVPIEIGADSPNRVGYLVVEDAGPDRPAFHVGDGQGRLVGVYSMEFVAKKAIEGKRKEVEKARKANRDARLLEKELTEREPRSPSRAERDTCSGTNKVRDRLGTLAARGSKACPKTHRRVGPLRAGDFGLRASVERTGAGLAGLWVLSPLGQGAGATAVVSSASRLAPF